MKKTLFAILSLASFNSFASDCVKGFCVNDIIISNKGIKGQVKAILSNGNVMIQFNDSEGFHQWKTSSLARTKGCTTNNFCVDDSIITDTGLEGTIKGIFTNGTVTINFNRHDGYHQWSTDELAITKHSTN